MVSIFVITYRPLILVLVCVIPETLRRDRMTTSHVSLYPTRSSSSPTCGRSSILPFPSLALLSIDSLPIYSLFVRAMFFEAWCCYLSQLAGADVIGIRSYLSASRLHFWNEVRCILRWPISTIYPPFTQVSWPGPDGAIHVNYRPFSVSSFMYVKLYLQWISLWHFSPPQITSLISPLLRCPCIIL